MESDDVCSSWVRTCAGISGDTAGSRKFGKERVRDTPIAEAGFVGTAAGAAMVGMRPVIDWAARVLLRGLRPARVDHRQVHLPVRRPARVPLYLPRPMIYGGSMRPNTGTGRLPP